jgi:hypothetical protein
MTKLKKINILISDQSNKSASHTPHLFAAPIRHNPQFVKGKTFA